MNAGHRHQEIQELLGAFALDAVDAHEASAIEDHLRECPRCRAEVASHRETAALLVDFHVEPSSALWDRVAASLDEAAPPPLDLSRLASIAPRSRPAAVRLLAVAAAVAVVLGLGGVTLQQQREVDELQTALARQELAVTASSAFDEPEARTATLRAGDGSLALRAVVLPDGSGYLVAERLPRLDPQRTYQLWGIVEGEPVSARVLGAAPTVVRFTLPVGATALAISEERAGGATEPTLPALLTGLVEA